MLPKGIEDRDADVWEPLLAVAELAGGHWPERARVAAVAAVAADGVKTTPSPGIELLADIKAVFDQLQVEAIFTTNLLAELATHGPALAQAGRQEAGPHAARLRDEPDQQGPAHRRARSPRATGGSTSRTPGRATCRLRLHRLHRLQTRGTTMSEDSCPPTSRSVTPTHCARSTSKDGRLASIAQRGGHWEDGKCEATCLTSRRPRP